MSVRYSIIIPVKEINDYVRETVPHICNLKFIEWELIILPNEKTESEWQNDKIKIIPSGQVGPAQKRDMGASFAEGDILVFLDDDSYPDANLLNIADNVFTDREIVALGGPAITPPHDSFWQKVSGAVFLSKFSGGAPERYISTGKLKEIDDWPSVNLMVRRDDFLKIGGFNSLYWPGEDTKLCLDLIKETGKKILYVPEMIVWHHRREGILAHLKQIGGYGLHRGYFAKIYPETSRKLTYFIPTAFVIFVILTMFYSLLPDLGQLLIKIGWLIYGVSLIIVIKDICRYESFPIAIVSISYVIATHLYYGIRFAQGLLTNNLVSKLR